MTKRKRVPASVDDLLVAIQRAADERRQATTNRLRNDFLPRLQSLGVAEVSVDYSGYGDSGAIDFVDFEDAGGKPIDVEARDAGLVDDLRELVYEFLPDGFENGDGGQGDLYIDVVSGTVRLDHGENYTETRSTTREFTL